MGIMTVRDVKDLEAAGQDPQQGERRQGRCPGGRSDVIIQEGVLTNERIHDAVAEPVVYMIDRYVVGGFYRVHAERAVDENLNAPGARFVPLAFEQRPPAQARASSRRQRAQPLLHVRRDRAAGLVAASYELEATDPELPDAD
jgi:glutamate--cysteine ligase